MITSGGWRNVDNISQGFMGIIFRRVEVGMKHQHILV